MTPRSTQRRLKRTTARAFASTLHIRVCLAKASLFLTQKANKRTQLQNNKSIERQRDAYARREEGLQSRIDEQSKELAYLHSNRFPSMPELEEQEHAIDQLHSQVLHAIDNIRGTYADKLADERRSMLQAFKARMSRNEEKAVDNAGNEESDRQRWIDRASRLRQELEAERRKRLELDNRLKKKEEAAERYAKEYRAQQDDRHLLTTSIVHAKRENARLTEQLEAATRRAEEAEEAAQAAQVQTQAALAAAARAGNADVEEAYGEFSGRAESLINKLKKSLEKARAEARRARTLQLEEVARRNELQNLIKLSIDDVREQADSVRRDAERSERHAARRAPIHTPLFRQRASPPDAVAAPPPPDAAYNLGLRPRSAVARARPGTGQPLAVQRRPFSATQVVGSAASRAFARPNMAPTSRVVQARGARPLSATAAAADAVARARARPLSAIASAGVGAVGGGQQQQQQHPSPLQQKVDAEREKVLARLLSREKLLTLLFRRAFEEGGGGQTAEETTEEDELTELEARQARDEYLGDLMDIGVDFDEDEDEEEEY